MIGLSFGTGAEQPRGRRASESGEMDVIYNRARHVNGQY